MALSQSSSGICPPGRVTSSVSGGAPPRRAGGAGGTAATGGVAGTGIAWGICIVVARTTPLKATVTPGVIGLAFGVCLAVGLALQKGGRVMRPVAV